MLVLPSSGLHVYSMEYWLHVIRARVDEAHPRIPWVTLKDVSEQSTLLGWLGEADWLSVRKPREPWLVLCRVLL